MTHHRKRTHNRVPDPADPDFFRKYVVPEELLDWAWGRQSLPPRPVVNGDSPSVAELR